MAGMVGVLHQLSTLAAQAHEIFDGLTAEAANSARRVTDLQERLGFATDRLARVDDALSAANHDELSVICTQSRGTEFRAPSDERSGLFTAASRPPSLQMAFDAARAPPPLDILDKLVKPPEGGGKYAKYGLSDTCADGYSDKHFFLKRWLDEEERKLLALKAERKARRAERRANQGIDAAQSTVKQEPKQVVRKKLTEEEKLGIASERAPPAAEPPKPPSPTPPPPPQVVVRAAPPPTTVPGPPPAVRRLLGAERGRSARGEWDAAAAAAAAADDANKVRGGAHATAAAAILRWWSTAAAAATTSSSATAASADDASRGGGDGGGGGAEFGGEGGRDDLLAAIRKGATGGLKRRAPRDGRQARIGGRLAQWPPRRDPRERAQEGRRPEEGGASGPDVAWRPERRGDFEPACRACQRLGDGR